ncbi:3'-5' exonuclease [Aliidiomarina iranensis]|uniref:3'-5' exonuclease n=1 Tax=Aliidiomarina iranensis TaxID=1434071 RepID=A0A432W385_9GAMM|nr:3'-5' exonuclease [Aliidiomarina iranensis]RUO23659.1 3'-5' exonuclease [Aliidiomarina iranensis]
MFEKMANWQHLRMPWRSAKWLAIDIETNGLDAKGDAMLALAWVAIQPPRIMLNEAEYRVVNTNLELTQSAVVHQLSLSDIAAGLPLEEVLQDFIEAAEGAIIVAHNAQFDAAVLQQALKQTNMSWHPDGVYCTLRAERRRLERQSKTLKPDSLTLAACRERYGFDAFSGHHALNDAIACAELFLAQAFRYSSGHTPNARSLLKEGR